MYAGKSRPILIPQVGDNARLVTLRNGYIYYITNRRWDKQRKRTIDDRVCIGKVDPDNETMMFPGRNFESVFGAQSANDMNVHHNDGSGFEQLKTAGRIDTTLSYAPFAILDTLAEHIGLRTALQNAMPRLWKHVLALAAHAIISQSSTAQRFPYWAFDHWCGLSAPPSEAEIRRIYTEIGEAPHLIQQFFEQYQKAYHDHFPCTRERVVALDSTNQVTESTGQRLAQRGKSKTGEKHPIINTAMYVDEETGISLWYEHFDGNVLDKSQTPYSVEKAQYLGFAKLFVMMDRGYFGEGALNRLDSLGVGFGVMMPESVSLASKLIATWKDQIRFNESWYILNEGVYGVQSSVKLSSGDAMYSYVYFDPKTYVDEYKAVHESLEYHMAEAGKRVRYSHKMKEHFARLGIIVTRRPHNEKTGQNFTLEVDHTVVQQAIDEAGFFVILSNRLMPPEHMITIARRRDCAEKAFKDLKTHFGLSRTYTHSDESYQGKMFTAFISLVLLQTFRWITRPLLHGRTSDTVMTLLGELGKYKIRVSEEGTCFPLYVMNKKQKAVFAAVNRTEKQVEDAVRSLKINRL